MDMNHASVGWPVDLSWEWVFTARVVTVRHIPKGVRALWAEVYSSALQEVAADPHLLSSWLKVFALPKLVLRCPPRGGKRSDNRWNTYRWFQGLLTRAKRGEWESLFNDANRTCHPVPLRGRPPKAAVNPADEITRHRVLQLIEEGQYSKAAKALVSEGVFQLDESVLAQLAEKHPQGTSYVPTEAALPQAHSECRECLPFDAASVLAAIRSFPRGTAPGASGLRAQHLVDALESPSLAEDCQVVAVLAKVCSSLATGDVASDLAPWMAGAPIFPLKKKDKGIRPIAVGEVMRRLVGKLWLGSSKIKEKYEPFLKDVGQLGVRVKNGADRIIMALRHWTNKPENLRHIVLKIDFSNAFNSVSRKAVAEAISKCCPALLPWFEFCYAEPAFLFCQNQKLPFGSWQGVQQGDPLGPLFFALAIAHICQKIKEECPSALSLWYLDDGVMAGTVEEVLNAWHCIENLCGEVGLSLNISKCELWTHTPAEVDLSGFPAEMRRLAPEGFDLLGVPIGTKEFCETSTRRRVAKIRSFLSKLHVIDDPQAELALVRCCLGYPRFAFAIRATPPDLISTAIDEFDSLMDEVSAERFDLAFDEDTKRQWHLPVRMGGVGIAKAAEAAPAAYLGNVLFSHEHVGELLSTDIDCMDIPGAEAAWNMFKEILEGTEDPLPQEVLDVLSNSELFHRVAPADGESPKDFVARARTAGDKDQHCLHSLVQEKRLRQWLAHRPPAYGEPPERNLLRKLSVIRGDADVGYVGSWLNVVPNKATGFKMPKPMFVALLKWWFGNFVCPQGQCPETSLRNIQCPVLLDPWGDHAVMCHTGATCIARHDWVNVTWMATLKSLGYHVRREIRVDPASQRRSADTFVLNWEEGTPAAHDWTVTHVLAADGLRAHSLDPNWACQTAEMRKVTKDAGLCRSRGVDFVPLATDTFGGFGPSAKDALLKVANRGRVTDGDEATVSVKRLAQKMRFSTMKGLGTQLIVRATRRMAELRQDFESLASNSNIDPDTVSQYNRLLWSDISPGNFLATNVDSPPIEFPLAVTTTMETRPCRHLLVLRQIFLIRSNLRIPCLSTPQRTAPHHHSRGQPHHHRLILQVPIKKPSTTQSSMIAPSPFFQFHLLLTTLFRSRCLSSLSGRTWMFSEKSHSLT